MSYELRLEERRSHLYAAVSGDRTPENARRFLEEAYAACVERGYSGLLLDMQLTGPSLGQDHVSRVISARAPEGAKLRKIAYVENSPGDPAMTYLAESEAISQGVNVRVFRDVPAAERWLSENWRFKA